MSGTGTGRRRSVDLRREEILTATLEQVDQLGLAATRVADVAQALGVSAGLVFYHFGTKDQLLAEAFAFAVDRDLQRLHTRARRSSDPCDRLRQAVRRYGPDRLAPRAGGSGSTRGRSRSASRPSARSSRTWTTAGARRSAR